jgi:hypothetical protein
VLVLLFIVLSVLIHALAFVARALTDPGVPLLVQLESYWWIGPAAAGLLMLLWYCTRRPKPGQASYYQAVSLHALKRAFSGKVVHITLEFFNRSYADQFLATNHDAQRLSDLAEPSALQPRRSAMAIVAFVFACLFFFPLAPVVGSILGLVSLIRLKRNPNYTGRGLAIAAIVVGLAATSFQGWGVAALIESERMLTTVEAKQALNRLAAEAKNHALTPSNTGGAAGLRGFPVGESDWVPKTPCCQQPTAPKCLPSSAQWRTPPWSQLRFRVFELQHFQYRYRGERRSFQAEARADFDCDGIYSSFRINGDLTNDGKVLLKGPVVDKPTE